MNLVLNKHINVYLIIITLSINSLHAMFENFISDTMHGAAFNDDFVGEIHRPFGSLKGAQQIVAKGLIQAHNTIDDMPEFRVYFDGKVAVSDNSGFYSFPVDDQDLSKYRIIITRRIQHVFDKNNTVNGFKIVPDKDYICYTFRRVGHSGSWVKKIKPLDKRNFFLPEKSIVVLISPKYVERVDQWNLELPKNIVKLPKIVLRPNISEKALSRIAAKSLLCLEDTVFHERVGRIKDDSEKQNSKVRVMLP